MPSDITGYELLGPENDGSPQSIESSRNRITRCRLIVNSRSQCAAIHGEQV